MYEIARLPCLDLLCVPSLAVNKVLAAAKNTRAHFVFGCDIAKPSQLGNRMLKSLKFPCWTIRVMQGQNRWR